MKQYFIDGLRPGDYDKLKDYFDKNVELSPVEGIYWLELDKEILTPVQKRHIKCQPHVFAIILEKTCLSFEFLVRIKKNIKCSCMGYTTKAQHNWLIDKADAILEQLDICI